jgi:hypothetical protein
MSTWRANFPPRETMTELRRLGPLPHRVNELAIGSWWSADWSFDYMARFRTIPGSLFRVSDGYVIRG